MNMRFSTNLNDLTVGLHVTKCHKMRVPCSVAILLNAEA